MNETTRRRFPAPWKVQPIAGGFTVQDANGMVLAYLYSDNNRMTSASYTLEKLTVSEAYLLARWIARLPELISDKRQQNAVQSPTSEV